jgi:type I restriction enzyme S subunit
VRDGWQTKKLGDLCKIELGKTPARANKLFWDEKRETNNVWLSIADLLNGDDNIVVDSKEYLSDKGANISKIVRKGTLLVSFKLTLGRLAFAGRDVFTNEAIAALTILNERELSKEYLFYFLHFFDWRKAAENDVKLKGMTLNKAKLRKIEVYFPVLPQQKCIVSILDEAFDGISAAVAGAEKNLANVRELFDVYLRVALSKRGPGWTEKTLKEVSAEFGRGKSKHRPRGDAKLLGGPYPLIQTGDVANSNHLIVGYSQTYNECGLAQSKLWPRGTVCIAIVGANVAETAILDFDACFPDSVIGLVVNDKLADNEYVEFLLQTFKAVLKERGKGTARDNINLGTFENQTFPFPDVEEQRRIVANINELADQTQRLEAIYKQKLAALGELRQSILQKAFAGELTALPEKALQEAAA